MRVLENTIWHPDLKNYIWSVLVAYSFLLVSLIFAYCSSLLSVVHCIIFGMWLADYLFILCGFSWHTPRYFFIVLTASVSFCQFHMPPCSLMMTFCLLLHNILCSFMLLIFCRRYLANDKNNSVSRLITSY